ncbi:hypothetical protein OAS65_01695 [Methylophilaceae bacterium]|nr:hypothetical protein [Methylophilaceae bacterium]
MNKQLFLVLKKLPFEATLSGDKKIEYRRKSDWIKSRLIDKNYNYVKFTHGYGNDKPFIILEYKGWSLAEKQKKIFSNGLIVDVARGDYEIYLGKIIDRGNIR